MGLDMYLNRKHNIKNWAHNPAERQYSVEVKTKTGVSLPTFNNDNVSYIVEEAMYWRKANAIHNWFVKNVQNGDDDCGTYYVGVDKLKELLTACETEISNEGKDTEDEALKPTVGFFFGSTDKDEWYYNTLKETVKVLTELIAEDSAANHIIEYEYLSSW